MNDRFNPDKASPASEREAMVRSARLIGSMLPPETEEQFNAVRDHLAGVSKDLLNLAVHSWNTQFGSAAANRMVLDLASRLAAGVVSGIVSQATDGQVIGDADRKVTVTRGLKNMTALSTLGHMFANAAKETLVILDAKGEVLTVASEKMDESKGRG